MKLRSFSYLAILAVLFSCSENKKTTSPPPAPGSTEATVTPAPVSPDSVVVNKTDSPGDSLMKFIISFYSIGSGIDRGQPERLKLYIEAFEKKSSLKVDFSEVHWGREGETDYCFPLTGWNENQVTDFIRGAKEELKGSEHVHFFQNKECRKRRD